MVDEDVRSIQPQGLALAILIVSIVCLVTSFTAVSIRTYTRWKEHTFGPDDALIIAGLVIYAVDVGLAVHGTTVGLGARNADLNTWLTKEGLKYLMIWMMVYIISLAVIKGSICVTLYRIGYANTHYKIAIYTLLAFTIATMLVTLIGVLLLCRPVSANWTGEGECAGSGTMIALSYTSTASTIITDLSLAILPGIMVWNTIMDPRQKIFICVLLSFGSIASITTMIRAPYIEHYWTPLDNLDYWTGYIVLLSNLESAIGCIASSAPTFRKFGQRRAKHNSDKLKGSSGNNGAGGGDQKASLITFGSLPVRNYSSSKLFRNPTDQGVSFASVQAGSQHGNKWNRLPDHTGTDGSSDTLGRDEEENGFDGIRAEYTYEVELTQLKS